MRPMKQLFGLLFLSLASVWSGTGRAADADGAALYQATTIVTGMGEEGRRTGFPACLRDVLVKVSGDPRLLDSPGLAPMIAKAGDYVAAFHYHDRMAGIPVHDEQGTHDRPYDLTCDFTPATIDPLLALLGGKPWLTPRPVVTVFLAARNGPSAFIVTNAGRESSAMREAFTDVAAQVAIPVRFPVAANLRRDGISAGSLPRIGLPALDAMADEAGGGGQALAGLIVWSDREPGWISEWRFFSGDQTAIWQVRAGSFDQAFRAAMRGVAQLLSSNGTPG